MEEEQPKEVEEVQSVKVDPDSTAVREPAYEEVEESGSEVKVRRLSRTRIMAIVAVVGVLVLGLMATQIFSGTDHQKAAEATEDDEAFDEAPVAKLDELEQRASNSDETKVPDKEAELLSKEEEEMKQAESLQAALEKREEEKEEEEDGEEDPWERARKDAQRRHAQKFHQQSLAARGSGVFPRVEAPMASGGNNERGDDDYDPERERSQFLSDLQRARAGAAASGQGSGVTAATRAGGMDANALAEREVDAAARHPCGGPRGTKWVVR